MDFSKEEGNLQNLLLCNNLRESGERLRVGEWSLFLGEALLAKRPPRWLVGEWQVIFDQT